MSILRRTGSPNQRIEAVTQNVDRAADSSSNSSNGWGAGSVRGNGDPRKANRAEGRPRNRIVQLLSRTDSREE